MWSTISQLFVPNPTPVPQLPHPRPVFQTLYSFDDGWRPMKPNGDSSVCLDARFGILTWNIDFSGPLPILRFQTVLSFLEELLSPDDKPTIILLQEFHKSCFSTLHSNPFIRATYTLSDTSGSTWDPNSSFGLLTLVPKSLSGHVTSIFRTPFPTSKMGRDALYIDLNWAKKVRIANTHLESLPGHGDRVRPAQMQSISEFLSSPGISGGLVGGDMNAISPSDATIHEAAGLTDAWLGDEGDTWGYQPPTVFPPGRLDKVLFKGCLKVERIERVGIGLKCGDSWVSDHYGLFASVVVESELP